MKEKFGNVDWNKLKKKMTEKTKKELPTTNIGKLPKEKTKEELSNEELKKLIEEVKKLRNRIALIKATADEGFI